MFPIAAMEPVSLRYVRNRPPCRDPFLFPAMTVHDAFIDQ